MINSEQHRRACEARYVLKMPDDKRQAYYQGVLEKRGQKGVDELIAEVKKQRRAAKEMER